MKFCVIGLGRFGYHIAKTLANLGAEVLAIDEDETIIASIRDKVTQAVCMHVEDEEALRAVGIEEMETVVVAMGENLAQSILLTALLKKNLGINRVIARSTSKIHENILKLIGADKVVAPELEEGIRLAHNLSFPFIDLVNITDDFSITLIKAPHSFIGKSLGELDLRASRHVTCIGVKKDERIMLTDLGYVILDNDQLVLAGENHYLEALTRL